jgi:hypothetical protein
VTEIEFTGQPVSSKIEILMGSLIATAWMFGAAFNTSTSGPFTQTNNGYFATWICTCK